MKKSFLILAPLLLLSLLTHGQQSVKPFAAIYQHVTQQGALYRFDVSPQIGLQYKKHQWAMGALILAAEFPAIGQKVPALNGGIACYRYRFTKAEPNRLYLFGELSSKLQFFEDSWTSNYWHESSQSYLNYTLGSREHSWGNYLGLGAGFTAGSAISFQGSLSVGTTSSRLYPIGDSSLDSQAEFDYRGYANNSISYAVTVGLLYSFKK